MSRWPFSMRGQFSLRMMLFFMFFVCAGLAIFRWPWEETEYEDASIHTTQYRRGWNGAPLQHGHERVVSPSKKLTYEAIYEDGVFRRQRNYEPAGVLQQELTHFPERGTTVKKEFLTSRAQAFVFQTIQRESPWRTHDQWGTAGNIWESFAMQEIDEEARLTHWNEVPIATALEKFGAALPDEQTRQAWLLERNAPGAETVLHLGDATLQIRPFTDASPGTHPRQNNSDETLVHIVLGAIDRTAPSDLQLHAIAHSLRAMGTGQKSHQSLAEQVLAVVKLWQATLRVRYGVVCCIAIDNPDLRNEDPAGVLQVKFAADSPQARDWLQGARRMPVDCPSHAERLQRFFAGASFTLNVSQITQVDLPPPSHVSSIVEQKSKPLEILRPRRDILGIFLWRNNYRIEQRGSTLTVLPRGFPG